MKQWLLMMVCLLGWQQLMAQVNDPGQETVNYRKQEAKSFKMYYIVFYKRNLKAEILSATEERQLQKDHLAYLNELKDHKHCLAFGPLDTGAGEDPQELIVFSGDSDKKEIKRLLKFDPALLTRHLKIKILKWWVPADQDKWCKDD